MKKIRLPTLALVFLIIVTTALGTAGVIVLNMRRRACLQKCLDRDLGKESCNWLCHNGRWP